MVIQRPRILLIDSYDSFTYNLAALCRQSIPDAHIHIIKNDQLILSRLLPLLDLFSAVIVGPGPGSPKVSTDVGIVKDLWKVKAHHLIPIFGVCLGLQSLGVEFGASLRRLPVVKHGQISCIQHNGTDVFAGVGKVEAVRYHSLCIQAEGNPELETLAWVDDGGDNGRVVMGLKHTSKPFWAVQYHPESVRTECGGIEVLRNFWKLAENWSKEHGREVRAWDAKAKDSVGSPWPQSEIPSQAPPLALLTATVATRMLDLPNLTVIAACELLGANEEAAPFVLLDSASQPGRWSIIGVTTSTSPRITYSVRDSCVHVVQGESSSKEKLGTRDIWSWLETYMQTKRAQGGHRDVPFWGGLVGYLSYELGVYSLPVGMPLASTQRGRHEDVNLVFIERSLVLDSRTGKIYVQSIISDDTEWLDVMSSRLEALAIPTPTNDDEKISTKPRAMACPGGTNVSLPEKDLYISRVKQAKEHLFSGDSYELCLTAPTRITVRTSPSSSSSSWKRYKSLRRTNPAPHSAYIRLHPTTILSSSPERFLSFTRPPNSVCQLRPIKGTVRKAPGITRAVAEELLAGSVKEVAENLMIVDLIRHDLHGVVGDDVQVKQFCQVEEYETVWQLVSVIEGKSDTHDVRYPHCIGWEVLKNSLPPGSMTGAPKKRSVEILQSLEDQERGIYSGVFGYWCVSGGGDWSVTIRSCFKHEQDTIAHSDCDTEVWAVGAGGAITALSDPEAEWEEMLVKAQVAITPFLEGGIDESAPVQ